MSTLVEYRRVEVVCEDLMEKSCTRRRFRMLIEEEGCPKLGSVARLKYKIR
jgi:hypothetical protein